MDLKLQRIKTGDLFLTTSGINVNSIIVRTFMMSSFNHSAFFVWLQTDDKPAFITDENIEEKFRLEYGPGRELFALEVTVDKKGRNYLRLIPYEKMAKYNDRCLHRGLTYNFEDRLDKFKKFFKYYQKTNVGTSKELFLSCWIHPVHPEAENIFERETCTSFFLLWLKMLGYSIKEPGVPYRSRQLYSPDHLLVKYNRSSLFENKETILKNASKSMSPVVYFITVFAVILIFVTMIVVFTNIYFPLNEPITTSKN